MNIEPKKKKKHLFDHINPQYPSDFRKNVPM